MQIDKTDSLATTSEASNLTVKNEDGIIAPFDSSRVEQTFNDAYLGSGSDAELCDKTKDLISDLSQQTVEALSVVQHPDGTVDTHDIRTQIEMTLMLNSQQNAVEQLK